MKIVEDAHFQGWKVRPRDYTQRDEVSLINLNYISNRT